MALWPSIMARSQCGDITVPLNRGYRPLVWLARVIGERESDSTQIASTEDGGGTEINQKDERGPGRTTKNRGGVGAQSAVGRGEEEEERGSGGRMGMNRFKGQWDVGKVSVCMSLNVHKFMS